MSMITATLTYNIDEGENYINQILHVISLYIYLYNYINSLPFAQIVNKVLFNQFFLSHPQHQTQDQTELSIHYTNKEITKSLIR